MSQPTEKRADELKIGDHVHDTRGRGPIEVAHLGRLRPGHPDERVLVVTADAAVSYHDLDEMFAMATEAEMAEQRWRRQRAAIVAQIRSWADWVEQHVELPPATSMDLRMQHSMTEFGSTDEDKLALAARVAEVLGVPVQAEPYNDGGVVRVRLETGDRYGTGEFAYVLHGFLKEAPVTPAEPEPGPEVEQTLPHYQTAGWKGEEPGSCGAECACGTTYDGFDTLAAASEMLDKHIAEGNAAAAKMRETPLDELPDDFGADHDPAECECEDCDVQVQHAETDEEREAREDFQSMGADEDREPLTVETSPVYADSVNGDEL